MSVWFLEVADSVRVCKNTKMLWLAKEIWEMMLIQISKYRRKQETIKNQIKTKKFIINKNFLLTTQFDQTPFFLMFVWILAMWLKSVWAFFKSFLSADMMTVPLKLESRSTGVIWLHSSWKLCGQRYVFVRKIIVQNIIKSMWIERLFFANQTDFFVVELRHFYLYFILEDFIYPTSETELNEGCKGPLP